MAKTQYELGPWTLKHLYPGDDSPELNKSLEEIEAMLVEFEKRRDQLSDELESDLFLEMLGEYEAVTRELSIFNAYAFLRFAEATQDQGAQALHAQAQQLVAEVTNRVLFFQLWWKGLDEEPSKRLMKSAGDNGYYLEALRLYKPYTLSESEEKIINLKDVNGSKALYNLYETITNRYQFELEVDGESKEMTRDELMIYVMSPDADLRMNAYQEQFRVYSADAPILGQIYQYMLRDWRSENITVRGFTSPIAVRNLANDVPNEVIDTLLDVARESVGVFHRYFQLKAKWLGIEKLRRYDVYAPLATSEKTYNYEEAVSLVMESFEDFDPQIATLARRVLDEGHLDSEIRKGKWGGAFMMSVPPKMTPYVLANFHGRPRDVATLAHELGHAVHVMLAEEHSVLTYHSNLPLAETASTFGEMLLMDRMIELDPDPEIQRDLLIEHLNDAYATIMRQSYFALFERTAHQAVGDGASVDELSELYFKNLEEQFGDSLKLSDDFKHEWVVIPHFFDRPFYVYAYAFGQLLVLSLYQQFKQEGDSFKPRYLDLLATGGADAPMRILDKAGVDVRTADFWKGGFQVLKEAMDRLEALEASAETNVSDG